MTIDLTAGRLADLDAVLEVSDAAFDPRFGEAWSGAQLRGTLTQPGSWLRLAVRGSLPLGFSLCRPLVDEAELLLIEPSGTANTGDAAPAAPRLVI